jgi:Predicted amidohydrolase
MTRKIRTAVAQVGGIQRSETRTSVIKRLLGLLREAASHGCKLVVFPELTLTTFFPRWLMETSEEVDAYFESQMPNELVAPLFEEARRLQIGFYLGYAELDKTGGRVRHFNTSILVASDGTILGKYRKIHLPGTYEAVTGASFQHLEKRYFEPGDLGFPLWRAFEGIFGMCLCNDRRWPETYRVMALKGVEMVLLGYNTPDTAIRYNDVPSSYTHQYGQLRMFHNHVTMQASAYQNGIWVAAAAKSGVEDGFGLIGGSCIIAPTGEIAVRTLTDGDEVIHYDCDLDLGRYIRETVFNFDKHRRIEEYRIITEQIGARVLTEN